MPQALNSLVLDNPKLSPKISEKSQDLTSLQLLCLGLLSPYVLNLCYIKLLRCETQQFPVPPEKPFPTEAFVTHVDCSEALSGRDKERFNIIHPIISALKKSKLDISFHLLIEKYVMTEALCWTLRSQGCTTSRQVPTFMELLDQQGSLVTKQTHR